MNEATCVEQVMITVISLNQPQAQVEAKTDITALHNMCQHLHSPVPVGCRNGGCGVCKVQVLAGDYQAKAMSKAHISEQELSENIVLACRIIPKTDLTLKVLKTTN